jgi:uncharacterized protein (TIGR02246 family)
MTPRLLAALVAACALCLARSVSAQQDLAGAEAARAAVSSFEHAWNAHDMDAFAELFTEDADFVNVGGTRWQSRARIKEVHAAMHATGFKTSHLTIVDTTIKALSPDVVVARSLWRLEGQLTQRGTPDTPRQGLLTNILVRQGPAWKIAVTQNTDIVE